MFRTLLFPLLSGLVALAAAERPSAGTEWATKYGIDLNAKGVYVNYEYGDRGFVFGFNPVANGDIYFHMAGPVTSSWIGVGFGTEMANALMFIAYPSANMANVTISIRQGTGHTEPEWAPEFTVEKFWHDGYAPAANTLTSTGAINAHAVCRNCSTWATGALDFHNTAQPMFWAMGPNKTFSSDDPTAGIPYHAAHGRFTADLTLATNLTGNYGRVPAPNIPDFIFPPTDAAFAAYGTKVSFDVEEQDYKIPGIHGLLMCAAFVILFPTGALVKLLLRRVLWHAAIQTIGFILVLVGFALSIRMSRLFIRSKDFNSSHQILGFFVVACLVIQFGLGLVHHAIFARTKSPTPLGRIHMMLGPIVMIVGLVNAPLGFRFAGNWEYNIPYTIAVVVIATVFFGLVGCVLMLKSRRKQYKAELDYEGPKFGPEDSSYRDMDVMQPPPGYGAEPPTPYEPPTPFPTQTLPYEPPQAYGPVVPYTPITAYTPSTPKTFKKMSITEYALQGDE